MKRYRVVKNCVSVIDEYITISVPERSDVESWLKQDLDNMRKEINELRKKIASLEEEKKQQENLFLKLSGELKQCVISTNEEAMTYCLSMMSKWMMDQINQKNAKKLKK